MATQYRSEKLEKAFAALSKNYRGLDVDLYAVSREKRQTTPVMEGDFMASLYGRQAEGLAFAIYDGAVPSDAALMYRNREAAGGALSANPAATQGNTGAVPDTMDSASAPGSTA